MRHLLTVVTVLLFLACCTTPGERIRMRADLDSLNQRNRNDLPFTPADVQPFVDYFDRHGTANDRLLAHYLMGRAYHEQGEAPMALQYYQQAAEYADTTDRDCDYAQLSRVYGQMGGIFYDQRLFKEQFESDSMAVKYAWLACDTLAALMITEQKGPTYQIMDKHNEAIIAIEQVAQLYELYGYPSYAAIARGSVVNSLIETGRYEKARQYLNECRQYVTDSLGRYVKGRELYYYYEGMANLSEQKLESAEKCFRTEINVAKDHNNQLAGAYGLAKLYTQLHMHDSVSKYMSIAYGENDSMHAERRSQEIAQAKSMYDYSQYQKTARIESEKSASEKLRRQQITAVLIVVVIVALVVFWCIYTAKREIKRQYARAEQELEQTQFEVLSLRSHLVDNESLRIQQEELKDMIAEKEERIAELRNQLNTQFDIKTNKRESVNKQIMSSGIYATLVRKSKGKTLTNEELRCSRQLIHELLPDFYNTLTDKRYKLSTRDFYVCILLRIGFKSKEISNMLDISQPRVSQICTKILENVFGLHEGSTKELIALLQQEY
jgi:tetratricopeptide (TPR) repeat protein